MAGAQAPKQWKLSTDETLTSFTNWKENLVYILSLNAAFSEFLPNNFVWSDGDVAGRGLRDDPMAVPEARRRTAAQKLQSLNMMLGQIANFCNVIARHQIVEESTSMNSIWAMLREHYGFHVTGSRFLDLSSIRLEPGEKAADLYQRLVSFFTDNLFTRASNLTHKGNAAVVDEKLSVSLQNTIIVLWLERLHSGLPGLIKQRYGTELRSRTLASIKPEISQALSSLLDELKSSNDDARVMRMQQPRSQASSRSYPPRNHNRNNNFSAGRSRDTGNPKMCSLCKTANIPGYDTHFLSQCKHISDRDRRLFSSRVRYIDVDEDQEYDDDVHEGEPDICETIDNGLFIDSPAPTIHRRITTRRSPHMSCFFNHYPASVCLDSGSESCLVSERFAKQAGMNISTQSVNQGAVQADSSSKLDIIGEVKNVVLRNGSHTFSLDALVCRNDIGDIIAGEPFLESNDIALRPFKQQIIIRGRDIIPYSNKSSL